jgi:putrescine importer
MSNTAPASEPRSSNSPSTLRRTLTLRDLVLYGIIVIQPVAPMSSFGAVADKGHGHSVTAILIAMVAMLLTAFSYGRMARVYPSAGSAFTYVGRELHPALGYITGWSMVLDYLVNPLICIIWCAGMAAQWSGWPRPIWAVLFFLLFTGFNLRGVKTSARFNTVLAAFMVGVIVAFLAAAVKYLAGTAGHIDFTRPFYDPTRWDTRAVFGATATAVLTYIGFDGISTLSEEVENPRRNILLATVLSCLAIGILSAIQVYAAQLLNPWTAPFGDANQEGAFGISAAKAAPWLSVMIGVTLLVANTGSGSGAQLGAARLLYGMGRSGALPKSFFAAVTEDGVPRNNVLLVGAIALFGSFFLSFGLGADLLNFGALIAFTGVNVATFVHYFIRQRQHTIGNLVPPLAGAAICALLWLNLSPVAKIVGVIWMAIGIAYGAWKTRGFRGDLVNFDVPADS